MADSDRIVILSLALSGVVISTIFGLRAIAKVLFGECSQALLEKHQEKPISDLTSSERIPALLLLVALLWIGIWPRTISDHIDEEAVNRFPDDPPHQIGRP